MDDSVVSVVGTAVVVDVEETVVVDGLAVDVVMLVGATVLEEVVVGRLLVVEGTFVDGLAVEVVLAGANVLGDVVG